MTWFADEVPGLPLLRLLPGDEHGPFLGSCYFSLTPMTTTPSYWWCGVLWCFGYGAYSNLDADWDSSSCNPDVAFLFWCTVS
jgi:hypothetical protein